MQRSVVLLHTTPHASSHYDWMIELDEHDAALGAEYRLMTWRCEHRPDLPLWDGRATQIAMHRAHYLDYEGVLDGDRGSVQRVGGGTVESFKNIGDRFKVSIRWGDHEISYEAQRPRDGDEWVFSSS